MTDLSALAARIARLEAVEDVRRVKLRYAALCDAGYAADELAALFTEDAVWDGDESHFGVHRGREAIRAFFAEISESFVFAMHYTLGGVVDVAPDLRSATASWYLWEPCSIVSEGEPRPMYVMGNYADAYRREGDAWRISGMTVRFTSIARADEGWVKRRFVL